MLRRMRGSASGPHLSETLGRVTPEADRTPVYRQIAGHIRDRIASGDLGEGDPVPTLAQLRSDWNVAVETARRALSLLQDEGLVVVRNGVRAVVASQRTVPAGSQVAEVLGIEEGQTVRVEVAGSSAIFTRVPS